MSRPLYQYMYCHENICDDTIPAQVSDLSLETHVRAMFVQSWFFVTRSCDVAGHDLVSCGVTCVSVDMLQKSIQTRKHTHKIQTKRVMMVQKSCAGEAACSVGRVGVSGGWVPHATLIPSANHAWVLNPRANEPLLHVGPQTTHTSIVPVTRGCQVHAYHIDTSQCGSPVHTRIIGSKQQWVSSPHVSKAYAGCMWVTSPHVHATDLACAPDHALGIEPMTPWCSPVPCH